MTTLSFTTETILGLVKTALAAVTGLDSSHVFIGPQDLSSSQNPRDGNAWASVRCTASYANGVDIQVEVFKAIAAPTPGARADTSGLTAIGDAIIYKMVQGSGGAISLTDEQNFGYTGPELAGDSPRHNTGAGLYVIEFNFRIPRVSM